MNEYWERRRKERSEECDHKSTFKKTLLDGEYVVCKDCGKIIKQLE